MRLFVAIDFDEKVKNEVVKIQKSIEGMYEGRLIKPKHLHLTLKFLGEVNDASEIIEKLKKVKFSEFEAEIDSIGMFSNRIIWLHVKNIDELQKRVDVSLGEMENRFMSHLTIARTKRIYELPKKRYSIKFKVKNFKLISSVLTAEGPEYETILTVPSSHQSLLPD